MYAESEVGLRLTESEESEVLEKWLKLKVIAHSRSWSLIDAHEPSIDVVYGFFRVSRRWLFQELTSCKDSLLKSAIFYDNRAIIISD